MAQSSPHDINRLIGEFTELQERWTDQPAGFDWGRLAALAQRGAEAYNDGAGPSFHSLALDGVEHTEFHERFLAALVEAGFDPFRLVHAGEGMAALPAIDHADLATAARDNPSSARMRESLMQLARARFEEIAGDAALQDPASPERAVLLGSAESIPVDILARVSPDIAQSQKRNAAPEARQRVDPVEGYLSQAEMRVDDVSKPYG